VIVEGVWLGSLVRAFIAEDSAELFSAYSALLLELTKFYDTLNSSNPNTISNSNSNHQNSNRENPIRALLRRPSNEKKLRGRLQSTELEAHTKELLLLAGLH